MSEQVIVLRRWTLYPFSVYPALQKPVCTLTFVPHIFPSPCFIQESPANKQDNRRVVSRAESWSEAASLWRTFFTLPVGAQIPVISHRRVVFVLLQGINTMKEHTDDCTSHFKYWYRVLYTWCHVTQTWLNTRRGMSNGFEFITNSVYTLL